MKGARFVACLVLLGCGAGDSDLPPVTMALQLFGLEPSRVGSVTLELRFAQPLGFGDSERTMTVEGVPMTARVRDRLYEVVMPGTVLAPGTFELSIAATPQVTARFAVWVEVADAQGRPFGFACALTDASADALRFGPAQERVDLIIRSGDVAAGSSACSVSQNVDGGTSDGGPTLDGGASEDGGASSDGGPSEDGGSSLDGGASEDSGSSLDGGSSIDGGASEDGGTADGGNPVPSQPAVTISPAAPTTTDALVATITTPSVDPGGAPVTYEYAWVLNGTVQTDLTGDTVSAARTVKSQQWKVRVTPVAAGRSGPAGESQIVTIRNSPPSVAGMAVYPLDPVVGQTLTARPVGASDPDGPSDPTFYDYQWYVVGDGGIETPIASATSNKLSTSSGFAPGARIRVTATPRDVSDPGTPVRSCPRALGDPAVPRWRLEYPTALNAGYILLGTPVIVDPRAHRALFWEGARSFRYKTASLWEYALEQGILADPPQPGSPTSGSSTLITWSRLSPSGDAPDVQAAQWVEDDEHGRVIFFGGLGGTESAPTLPTTTSFLDLTQGCETWTTPAPSNPPSGRILGSFVYDAASHRAILFGGLQSFGPQPPLQDCWALSLQAGAEAWAPMGNGTPPPGRAGHYAVYDAANQQMIILGGTPGPDQSFMFQPLPDIWALSLRPGAPDFETWRQILPTGAPATNPPPARLGAGVAYHPGSGQVVFVGGCAGSSYGEFGCTSVFFRTAICSR
jgi:hypothetical protein